MPNSANAYSQIFCYRPLQRGLRTFICSFALATAQVSHAAPALEDLMTAEEFAAAGLHKLSAAEREALVRWLTEHSAGLKPLAAPPVADERDSTALPTASSPSRASADDAQVTAADAEQTTASLRQQEIDNFGLDEPRKRPDEITAIEARVTGKFRGWNGDTVFRLDNGQVWRQRTAGQYYYSGEDSRVEIGKNGMGFYELKLLAAGRTVGVKRVE